MVEPAVGTRNMFDAVFEPKSKIRAQVWFVVTFTQAPGTDPRDWIAVYPVGPNGPILPAGKPVLFQYVGGAHTPTMAPKMGSVTLDAGSVGAGPWPLATGLYTAYYLLDGGYMSVATADFVVQ